MLKPRQRQQPHRPATHPGRAREEADRDGQQRAIHHIENRKFNTLAQEAIRTIRARLQKNGLTEGTPAYDAAVRRAAAEPPERSQAHQSRPGCAATKLGKTMLYQQGEQNDGP